MENSALCISFLIAFIALQPTGAQHPPKRLHTGAETRKVAAVGSTVALPCPVERPSGDDIYIEWTKDGESLMAIDSRIRKSSMGVLRIKTVRLEDTGFYLCKAINGFGSIEIGINLIVLENDLSDGNNTGFDLDARPRFTMATKSSELIRRPAGSSIRFKCEATGHPRPTISWFYNHNMMPARDSVSRRNRWSLLIDDLKPEDSGNYTCFVVNGYGNTSATFVLEVFDGVEPSKPELTGVHPRNTTARSGEAATFHCQVKSDTFPLIQWLKKISPRDLYQSTSSGSRADELATSSNHIITVDAEHYRVIKSNNQLVDASGAGVYVNKLVIEETRASDAGVYVCLATNAMGVTWRSASLAVSPGFPPMLVSPARELFLPVPIIVAAIGIFILVLVSSAFLLIHCRNQKRSGSSTPSIETNSARTACSNSPKHHPVLGLPIKGQVQLQQSLLDHRGSLRRPSPFGGHSQHHYSPVHSSHSSQHTSNQASVPTARLLNELIPGQSQQHAPNSHLSQQHSEKSNRSSSVSPAFLPPGHPQSVQYHQYYHIPQRTSYGYLC